MLLGSFRCIKLSFLWYYGQPGSKIISDLNVHPLQAGKTAAASFRRYQPCPSDPMGQSMTGPLLALSFSCCLVHTHILLSPKRSSLTEPFSPCCCCNPSPMYTLLPFLRGYTTKRDPKHQRCFSEKNIAKRKKKATKNLSSNFKPLVRFTFKNRNLDLPCFG